MPSSRVSPPPSLLLLQFFRRDSSWRDRQKCSTAGLFVRGVRPSVCQGKIQLAR